MDTAAYIESHKVICICRKIYEKDLLALSHALYQGGIRLMEITFDQSDPACEARTAAAISLLNREFGGDIQVGAGTVLTPSQVETAHEAGAAYIISPNTDLAVIRRTKELGMGSIPGAMTPSEILTAHNAGADFVKLFPAAWLGFSYLKDIRAPISHVKLIATGGVTEENFGQFLELGVVGAGVSSRLVDKKLRDAGDYAQLTARAEMFTAIARGHQI
ncbi:MAG: bifunctional 4-hydroxy-2-oxoglutarate aldolase/2-dehydro-3-deoxy-phosphogluconate aldolase [Clostridiales bacterium]|nr:bifunctional 4-hydroxy-2-oxoglutarate aldolase/2-dehydro-3-deoxy-phosphogluconate aldolase [Clostridiales bacterium]